MKLNPQQPFPFRVPYIFLFVLCLHTFSLQSVDGHVFHIDHTDDEISNMSIETLLHVENDLRQQNRAVDKKVASIHGRMAKLRLKQHDLEAAFKKLDSAHNWEVRKTEHRAHELEHAKAELESKRHQIAILSTKADKLKDDISDIESKMTSLNREDRILEREYANPSFRDALINQAGRMGNVEQQLVNKTMETVVPKLTVGWHQAERLQYSLEHGWRLGALFTTLCVYLMGISIMCVTYRCTKTMQRILTLPRLLFTVDVSMMCLWGLVLLTYLVLQQDPLILIAKEHAGLSVVLQILAMTCLIGNVMLRCLLLSMQLGVEAMIELMLCVAIGQHYYSAVWVPFLMDIPLRSSAGCYMGYLLIHTGMAVHRARRIRQVSVRGLVEEEGQRWEKQIECIRKKLKSFWDYCEDLLTTGVQARGSIYDNNDTRREIQGRARREEKEVGRGMKWGGEGRYRVMVGKRVGTLV